MENLGAVFEIIEGELLDQMDRRRERRADVYSEREESRYARSKIREAAKNI